jgi:hypothetical protein
MRIRFLSVVVLVVASSCMGCGPDPAAESTDLDPVTVPECECYVPAIEWVTPTLMPGWASEGFAYGIDTVGVVRFRGALRWIHPTTLSPGVAFTIPAGYRPDIDILFIAPTSELAQAMNIGRGYVLTTGEIRPAISDDATYVSLSGVSYVAVPTPGD